MGLSRNCWNSTSALQPEEITSKGTRVSCVYYQQKCPYEKSLETYLMIFVHTIVDNYNIYATYQQHNTNYFCNLVQISSLHKIPILYNIP